MSPACDDVKECNDCGEELKSVYQKKYPGRFLCMECVKSNLKQASLDGDWGRQSNSIDGKLSSARAPHGHFVANTEPGIVKQGGKFYPFSHEEADILHQHIAELLWNLPGMYWRSLEFIADRSDDLNRYKGRTWFTEKQWKYFLDIMAIIGWPKQLNKANMKYSTEAASL